MSKTALLFPGQGAQQVGMAQSLHASLPAVRDLFAAASEVLGYDLAQLCFEGPQEKLDLTDHSQPALLVASLSALEQLRSTQPDVLAAASACAGLSLGEYTALTFAGAIDFRSAVAVVRERGAAMQAASDANPSGMVSVLGLDVPGVEQLCDAARLPDEVLQVANLLCPGNTAVSGARGSCAKLHEIAAAAGAKTVPLAVAGAFHTGLMESAQDRLRTALDQVEIRPPRIPIISNVDAQPQSDPETIRQRLIEQVVRPVRWEASMQWFLANNYRQFYEVGPGKVLRGLLRRMDRGIACDNVLA